MQIKFQQKTLLYQGKIRNYVQIKKYVQEQLPELEGKNWVFTYIDAQGDQIILGDDDQLFDNTIQFYDSCQKKLVLIVKLAWWKTVKVHSRSSLVKTLLSKKSERIYTPPSSDSDSSDRDYINLEFNPGEIFYQDSQMHSVPSYREQSENSSSQNVARLKNLLEKKKSYECFKKISELQQSKIQKNQRHSDVPSFKNELDNQALTHPNPPIDSKVEFDIKNDLQQQSEPTIK